MTDNKQTEQVTEEVKQEETGVWNWVKRNKGKIGLTLLGVALGVGGTIAVSKYNEGKDDDKDNYYLEGPRDTYDSSGYGKDLVMKFVDPENDEVLGEIECTEKYMKDMID